MGDHTGFMRFQRQDAHKQRARQRIRHWHEYEQIMPAGQTSRQARRCMDCGTPDCHAYCPVYNLIPDWNELVGEDDWHSAYAQLASTNNFPEFTGRLCPAPCEDACTLRLTGSPVTIRCIELAVIEHAWQRGWIQPQRSSKRLFKRVAVIGSGPAGLACAQQLARVGYRVTVYEKSDRPGGLLRYGIPDFRLEKGILDRRIAQLEAEGVIFRSGAHAGVNLDIDELRRTAHAVVLACGSEQPRQLPVPGYALDGIHYAMDYLVQQNRRLAAVAADGDRVITAFEKDVAVIGGGDTGSDCVGTAIRQGARCVYQVQYHDRPPEHADVLDYWPEHVPEWHADDHDEEGCKHIWGYDTIAFEGLDHVSGLSLQRLQWLRQSDGNWKKQPMVNDVRHLPVQLVLLAMGYVHTRHAGLVEQLAVDLDGCGNVAASADEYATSAPDVFSCGDMRRGQSLIVWAIREGRQCARAVDVHLSGDSDLPRV
ncbi:MAG: glutamate synthase subunit beta [Pseudomonadota bacterium]